MQGLRPALAVTFWYGGCHSALPTRHLKLTEGGAALLSCRNVLLQNGTKGIVFSGIKGTVFSGKERPLEPREGKQRAHSSEKLPNTHIFMLHYTCHPKMYVAGISCPVRPPSAIRPSHSASTVSTQLPQLGENQILFLCLIIKAKRNSNCPIQLI